MNAILYDPLTSGNGSSSILNTILSLSSYDVTAAQ